MVGGYSISTEVQPPFLVAVFLASVSLYSWRRRNVPGATALAAGSLFAALWMFGVAMESAAVASDTKIFWHKFQAILQMPTVTASACFILEYAQPGRWLNRRNLALLSIPSLLVLLTVVVDNSQLMWRRLLVEPDGSILHVYAVPGAILVAVGFSFILINFSVLIWLFIRSPQHRWPVVLLVFGGLVARGFHLLSIYRVELPYIGNPTIISFAVIWVIYSIVLFGFHIFTPLTIARRAVIDQIQAGVVVFDDVWRVVSLNPAAERIFGIHTDAAQGWSWQELAHSGDSLTDIVELNTGDNDVSSSESEISLGSGSTMRLYVPALFPLQDFRGLTVGYLFMLRDVTERRKEQAQLLEQQRMLATLHERERLARELHDSIGQVLGYASLQADASRQLIDGGQAATAVDQLTRLAAVLQDAHADVREHILNLRITPSPQQSFFVAVQDYLDGFMNNYGIEAKCQIDGELEETALAPEAQMQLFRILQEGLSNARKHGKAHHVLVTFEDGQGSMRMRIADDGVGFDVDAAQAMNGSHMGLRFMRERAEELDGSLQVESTHDAGAQVTVIVPLEES